jgi:hypothetical protein
VQVPGYPQQYPPSGPYGPYGPYRPPPPPFNTYAILSIAFAVFVLPPLGIYFGRKAKEQIAQTGERGVELAQAGIVTGWVLSILLGGFLLVWCGLFGTFMLGFWGLLGGAAAGSTP